MTLSIIVITKNEAENIAACLASVAWADELIVVDSGSTDGTVEIAREFTSHVYLHTDWPGFGPQKNRALDYATGDWVLSLDADERVTPALRTEIEAVLAAPTADGYRIPRLSNFCGRFIHHSGWRPDYVLRLFRRSTGRFSQALVHESVALEGSVATLRHDLLHYSYRHFDDVISKTNAYSSAAAEQMLARGQRGGAGKAIGHGLWAFFRTYVFRAGFLDGREGFMLAVMNAENSYYRYIKLWFLQKNKNL